MKPKEDEDIFSKSTCELNLAQLLLLPPDSIQVQALKEELLRYLQDKLSDSEFVDTLRLRSNNLDEFDNEDKRSIANLAKNGQLPTFQKQDDNDKRSISSLARNGELHSKRELANLLNELTEKRNIASLARNSYLPYGRYSEGDNEKRNLASMVRNSGKRSYYYPEYYYDEYKRNLASVMRQTPKYVGKRNVAALLRQDTYLNGHEKLEDEEQQSKMPETVGENESEKRNIGSLKAQLKINRNLKRDKRQVDYDWQTSDEYPVPVYQNNNIYDYDELIRTLTGQYPETEKRFLGELSLINCFGRCKKRIVGSVAKTGWFRPTANNRYEGSGVTKRHIGALAKLGWLPSLRSARRFNRSGRSVRDAERFGMFVDP